MFLFECWQFGSGIKHEGAGLLGLGLLTVELWVLLPAQSVITMPGRNNTTLLIVCTDGG